MKLNSADQILHRQFSEYGLNAREWLRKCALLLPEIDRRQIWKKKGCSSIYEYAAKLAGMSRGMVDEALWVLRKAENHPELMKVIEEKGVHRVRPIISLTTPETASFWAEKARSMSKNTLETYAKNYRLELIPGNKMQAQKSTVLFDVSPALAKKLEVFKKRANFEELLNQFMDDLDAKTAELTAAKSRHIPVEVKREVSTRSSGLCAYPSCKKPATSFHHTQRFALEKVHDPQRLQALCTAHERLAHLGLIENEENSPSAWRLKERADPLDFKAYVDGFVRLYRPT